MAEGFLYLIFFLMFGTIYNRVTAAERKIEALEKENKRISEEARRIDSLASSLISDTNRIGADLAVLQRRFLQ